MKTKYLCILGLCLASVSANAASSFTCESVGAQSEAWSLDAKPVRICHADLALIEEDTLRRAVQDHQKSEAVRAFFGDYVPLPSDEQPSNYLPNPAFEMCKQAAGNFRNFKAPLKT